MSKRFGREECERIIKGCRSPAELDKNMPREVQRGFLEQDNTRGRGKDDRDTLKDNFHKFDPDVIRRAMGQPEDK